MLWSLERMGINAYCNHCGKEVPRGDPEYVVLCGNCVQKCLVQPIVEQPVEKPPKKDMIILQPIKRVTD